VRRKIQTNKLIHICDRGIAGAVSLLSVPTLPGPCGDVVLVPK
jgi:hypothetical protein